MPFLSGLWWRWRWQNLREAVARELAWRLPRRLVEWCFVRVVAHATTGPWSGTVVPEIPAVEALRRWTGR